MEDELFTIIKHFQINNNKIFQNKNIDLYTLGLYMKLCYLANTNGKTEDIYKLGKKEYIDMALQKLKNEKFIRFNGEDLEILE